MSNAKPELSELSKSICHFLQSNSSDKINGSVRCPTTGKVFNVINQKVPLAIAIVAFGTRYVTKNNGIVKIIDADSSRLMALVDSKKMLVTYVTPYGELRFDSVKIH